MKKFISILLITSILFTFSSCSLNGKLFNVGVSTSPDSFNPYTADCDSEKFIAANCFEGLLSFDEKGNIDLSGAVSYFMDKNMLKCTFNLNPSAVWHIPDGIILDDFNPAITADDFVFGFKLLLESGCVDFNTIMGYEKAVKEKDYSSLGVKALDDYTLEFTFSKPDVDFLYKLAANPVFPCNETIYKLLGSTAFAEINTTLTNGAYTAKAIDDDGKVTLITNPDYNGKLNTANKRITLIPTQSTQECLKKFEKGETDLYLTTTFDRIDNDSFTVASTVNDVWGFAFNCKSEFAKSKALRLLLISTLNFEIIKTPAFADGKATNIIPNNFYIDNEFYGDYPSKPLSFATNPENAVNQLDKILKAMNKSVIDLNVSVPKQLESSFRKVIDSWTAIFGEKIKFTLTSYKAEAAQTIIKKGNYDMGIFPLSPEELTPYSVLREINTPPCSYSSAELEKYITATYADNEKNAKAYAKAEQIIVSQGVFVPLYYASTQIYCNEGVTGFYTSPDGAMVYFHQGARSSQ